MTEVAVSCRRCGSEDPEVFGGDPELCMDCEKRIEQRRSPRRSGVRRPTGSVAVTMGEVGAAPEVVAKAPKPAPVQEVTLSTTDAAMSANLDQLESVIERWVSGFVGVGAALFAIRDRKLYLDQGYKTFEAYTFERWGMKHSQAYRLIEAASLADALSPIGEIENEAQARELLPAFKLGGTEAATEVYREAKEEYGDALTAKLIRAKVQERYAPEKRQQAEPTTTHALEEHLDTLGVEVVLYHRGEFDEARHTYRRAEWHSGRFHLPADVEMPATLSDLETVCRSIGQSLYRLMRNDRKPTTARWRSLTEA